MKDSIKNHLFVFIEREMTAKWKQFSVANEALWKNEAFFWD